MAVHSKSTIEKQENILKARFDALTLSMYGRPVNADEIYRENFPETHRVICADDVRIAIDDFSTILREIKATLGKRGS